MKKRQNKREMQVQCSSCLGGGEGKGDVGVGGSVWQGGKQG